MDEKILNFTDKFCKETIVKGKTGFIDTEIFVTKKNGGAHRIYKDDKNPTSLNYYARYCGSHVAHILIIIPEVKFFITSNEIRLMTPSTVLYVVVEDESALFNYSLNDNLVLSFSTLKTLQKNLELFKDEYSLKIYGDEL
ncbi:hypothetical protein XaC1_94 [Xanthomonas phage XaC1]|nr:hypothetical protein XaC1_94 [Xanthomonas phage XaC1]